MSYITSPNIPSRNLPSVESSELSNRKQVLLQAAVSHMLQAVLEKGKVSIFTNHETGETTQEIFTVGLRSEAISWVDAHVAKSYTRLPHLADMGDDEPRINVKLQEQTQAGVFGEPLRRMSITQTWAMAPGEFTTAYSHGPDALDAHIGALAMQTNEVEFLEQIIATEPDDADIVTMFRRPYTPGDHWVNIGQPVNVDGRYDDDHAAYWVRDKVQGSVGAGLLAARPIELA